jgi:hypothetical protein
LSQDVADKSLYVEGEVVPSGDCTMSKKTVRYRSPDSSKPVRIPASELASGSLRVQILGQEGDLFVDEDSLGSWSEIRHPPFPPEVRDRYFRRFERVFHDVNPMSLSEWEHCFRRELYPDQELQLCDRIATAFEHFTAGRDLSFEERKEIFKVIMAAVRNGKEFAPLTISAKTISQETIVKILEYVFAEEVLAKAPPILVTPAGQSE